MTWHLIIISVKVGVFKTIMGIKYESHCILVHFGEKTGRRYMKTDAYNNTFYNSFC